MNRHPSSRPLRALAGVGLAVAVAVPAAFASTAGATPTLDRRASSSHDTLVIGHRGASGYRPEHTLASYELAARMGADYIEPDLVTTKDGVLVARHEPEIGGTTDVSMRPEFASRLTTKSIDGVDVKGWYAEDFTLVELKTLRAKERLPAVRQENTMYDGRYEVPTFDEVLALRARLSKELHREIGVYPETKHPTFFRAQGKPLEELLVAALKRAGLNRPNAPVFVQSFELNNLVALNTTGGLRTNTVFLTGTSGGPFGDTRSYATLTSAAGLKSVAAQGIDGLGPNKNQVIPRNPDMTLGTPTALVANAHAAGLLVHPYTFRAENTFLPLDYRVGTDDSAFGRAIDEQIAYLRAGVDGVFTDQPDVGVVARDTFEATAAPAAKTRGARKAA